MTSLLLIFTMASQAFNLPTGLLSAVCYVESHHKRGAINPDDGGSPSLGVCQIKRTTANLVGYRGNVETLRTDDHVNAYYAAKYLSLQLNAYDGDLRKAVSAYNAGHHKLNENGLTVNREYVSKVFKAWSENR